MPKPNNPIFKSGHLLESSNSTSEYENINIKLDNLNPHDKKKVKSKDRIVHTCNISNSSDEDHHSTEQQAGLQGGGAALPPNHYSFRSDQTFSGMGKSDYLISTIYIIAHHILLIKAIIFITEPDNECRFYYGFRNLPGLKYYFCLDYLEPIEMLMINVVNLSLCLLVYKLNFIGGWSRLVKFYVYGMILLMLLGECMSIIYYFFVGF